jgi:uncharacterized protein DUF4345
MGEIAMMGHRLGTFVLIIAVLFCLLTTWTSGTAPAKFAERLGLSVANAGGVNEIRAQYAGFFFAAAVICIASLVGALSRQAAFAVLTTIFGGLIAGRAVSFVLDGGTTGYTPTILALYLIDSIGCVLALAGFAFDKPA